MGNKGLAPCLSSEEAARRVSSSQRAEMRQHYANMVHGQDAITLENFVRSRQQAMGCNPVFLVEADERTQRREGLVHRLFRVMDAKGDGKIDQDEFICAMATLQLGNVEEKNIFLLCMYDSSRSGGLKKEELVDLLADANAASETDDVASPEALLQRAREMRPLLEQMADMVLVQYGDADGNLKPEGLAQFVHIESSVQALLQVLSMLVQS